MSTPTDGPGDQPANPYGQPANPYGQPANPYGQPANPYGQPPAQPGGGGGYGAPFPGGGAASQPENKGLAIAALVLAVIACAIPNLISLVLAIIVLVKKKGGKGLAIAAIVIDVIVLAVWVLLFAGGLWLFNNIITVDDAKVGECVSTETDNDEVGLMKADCGEPHDAEVFVVGDLSADELTVYETEPAQICVERYTADGNSIADLPGDFINIVTNDLSPAEGDPFACLVENEDGSKLPAK